MPAWQSSVGGEEEDDGGDSPLMESEEREMLIGWLVGEVFAMVPGPSVMEPPSATLDCNDARRDCTRGRGVWGWERENYGMNQECFIEYVVKVDLPMGRRVQRGREGMFERDPGTDCKCGGIS